MTRRTALASIMAGLHALVTGKLPAPPQTFVLSKVPVNVGDYGLDFEIEHWEGVRWMVLNPDFRVRVLERRTEMDRRIDEAVLEVLNTFDDPVA